MNTDRIADAINARIERDIVLVQAMRNTIMVASVLVSASLLAAMAFVGATHTLAANDLRISRYFVAALALLAVAFSAVALVRLSRASRHHQAAMIEHLWDSAHRFVMISAGCLIAFTFGALWVALH